jgi:hypothetical protein
MLLLPHLLLDHPCQLLLLLLLLGQMLLQHHC